MKKFLIVLLTLIICATLCACTFTNEDGSTTIAGLAVTEGINILAKVLEAALMLAGTLALSAIRKQKSLQNTAAAFSNLLEATRQTVGELMQVFVNDWKEENVDGKLTPEQIGTLRQELIRLVTAKTDTETRLLIEAAGADLTALIIGEAENWINELKYFETEPPAETPTEA